MNEAAHIDNTETRSQSLSGRVNTSQISMKAASVRVSPGSYLSALLVFTVLATILFRFRLDYVAVVAFATGWLLMPVLAFTDRIVFDGKFIYRSGVLALIEGLIRGKKQRLSVEDIERIETVAVRTLIHGGRVHYRYRTEVTGKNLSFIFASGRGYRNMIRKLFLTVNCEKLDTRSCELRDYYVEPNELETNVSLLGIQTNDKIENSAASSRANKKRKTFYPNTMQEKDKEQGLLLRQTANQLRVTGRLKQAAEAFRRALTALPNDNWLLFEFARFLRSQANTLRDAGLLRRSSAALRLAKLRAKEDATLLSRIGESYFEFGEVDTAAKNFRQVIEQDMPSFRAEMGLAEVGIRNGKLAHVIHHYASAARIAPDKALQRLAQREIDYYSTLNSDEDYLDREIRRIDRLQFILFARRSSIRVTIIAFIFSLLSFAYDETLSNVGWAFTSISLALWCFFVMAGKFYTERNTIPSVK